jgi:hypothetical protein
MDTYSPKMFGDKIQIAAYVDPATYNKLEQMRGDVSRSRFIGKMIKKVIEQ